MKKRLSALILALVLLTLPASAFSDVDEGLYYAAPIAWAVEKGITTGTTETTFSPDALCTQGQILTFLWRAAGSPTVEMEIRESSSLDPDTLKAIGWGFDAGVLDGTVIPSAGLPGSSAGTVIFDPSAPCTRATAMNLLWRYAGSPTPGATAAFTDIAPEANYAQAVAWAVEQGLTGGTTDSTFSPDEICTRGQITTFLYRCLNEPGEKMEPLQDPVPVPVQEPGEEVRPQQTFTGQGKAYSLGLDGSEFTSDGAYEAEVTVDVYSSEEAVFAVKVPFPLFQACSYTVRFEDPDRPGEGYLFTFLRWDEAFADMIPWTGSHDSLRFTDISGDISIGSISQEDAGDDRFGGELVRRVAFSEDSTFSFDLLEGFYVTCEVSSSL